MTPLHKAIQAGSLPVAERLLKEPGIKINARDRFGMTPLLEAIKGGHSQIAKLLLCDYNPDVNAVYEFPRMEERSTCLHLAVDNGSIDIVRLLLMRKDLDPNIPDYYGLTPLGWAARKGNLQILKLLLGR